MQRVLVTGSGGFVGRHLVRRLRREGGYRIWGAGRHAKSHEDSTVDEYAQVDVTNRELVERLVAGVRPDIVFHLAAVASAPAPDMYTTNLVGTVHLLESIRTYAPSARVLLVGSAAEYGPVPRSMLPVDEDYPCDPRSVYGVSKYAMTRTGLHHAAGYGLQVVVARPFNIVGSGAPPSLLLGALLHRLKEALRPGVEPLIRIGNLDSERDYIAVEDAVEAYVRLVRGDFWGRVFNICSGQLTTVREILSIVLGLAPQPVRYVVDPALIRSSEPPAISGDWQRAYRAFGFHPTVTLHDAIRAAWRHEFDRVMDPQLAN